MASPKSAVLTIKSLIVVIFKTAEKKSSVIKQGFFFGSGIIVANCIHFF